MPRRMMMLALAAVVAVALAGCVGDTDPASPVRGTLAQLNAHGHTDNGPAYWWWEYDTSQSVVTNGSGAQTPHRGPASSSSDVKLSEVVRNLSPDTTYYSRACGQDQSSSTRVCGRILSFHTQVASLAYSFPNLRTEFHAASGTRNDVTVSYESSVNRLRYDDPIQTGFGASIQPVGDCAPVYTTGTRDDAVRCSWSPGLDTGVYLGDLDDRATVNLSDTRGVRIYGQGGADVLYGGAGDDYMSAGAGVAADYLRGNNGDDTIHAESGSRSDGDDIDCGPGNDTLYTDAGSLADNFGAKNCETIIPVSPGG